MLTSFRKRKRSRFVSDYSFAHEDYPGINPVDSAHVETVCLLSNRKLKPDTYIKLSLDMEDYYRIKDAEKEKNKTS